MSVFIIANSIERFLNLVTVFEVDFFMESKEHFWRKYDVKYSRDNDSSLSERLSYLKRYVIAC